MAKEFKDWDKKFSGTEIAAMRRCWNYGYPMERIDWVIYCQPRDKALIDWAVYKEATACDWQLFRVAMKGLTTGEKLRMMYNRWTVKVGVDMLEHQYEKGSQKLAEYIRIQNYTGALKRGGLLDNDLRVIK